MRALILGIMISVTGLAGDFCLVKGSGLELCYYHTAESCQQAANQQGGLCIYKPSVDTYEQDAASWGPTNDLFPSQPQQGQCIRNMWGYVICN